MGIVVADQLLKQWILAGFTPGESVDIADGYLRITLIHNSGALFGIFQGQAGLFALASLGVMALIVWFQSRAGTGNLILTLALGLLLGGAIGNLIDRLRFDYVLDFVDAGIGAWRWYTFNVADSAISMSLVLLLSQALWPVGPESSAEGGERSGAGDRAGGDAVDGGATRTGRSDGGAVASTDRPAAN